MSSFASITTTPEWQRLVALANEHDFDLRSLFQEDPDRARRWSFSAGDLHLDLSKNWIDDTVHSHLLALAERAGLREAINEQFSGAHINSTETGSDAIATVHIVAAPHGSSQLHEHQEILRQVEAILRSQFGITRTTVQIEFSPPGAERADDCVHSPHCAQSAQADAATSIPARAAAHHPDTTEHQGWQLWDKTAVSCRRNWRASVVRASGNRYHLTS